MIGTQCPLFARLRPLYLREPTFAARSPTTDFDPDFAIRIAVANFCLQARADEAGLSEWVCL